MNTRLMMCIVALVAFSLPLHAEDQKPAGKFELVSSAFKNNEDIPEAYTCKGGDINPPLQMLNVPAKAKSLALTVYDPSAPEGIWVHWVVYNIQPTKNDISENSKPGYLALNDFGKYDYSGPCPADEKPHRYIFRAYAVDTILEINEGMTMKDLEKTMGRHVVAKSELVGKYRKPIW